MPSLFERKPDGTGLVQRLRSELGQSLQRRLNGIEYFGTPPPPVGASARTLLHRRGTLSLYHYQPTAREIYRVPLLFVMPVTHNADIFDLTPGQSLFEFLLGRGYDVYVINWNAPRASESTLKLEDYVLDFIPTCIERVQADTGVQEVTLVGYCLGAVLASLYTALHPKGPVKNLVCFTMPVDFSKMFFGPLLENTPLDIETLVDGNGLLPGQVILRAIDLHRPASRVVSRLRLWDNMWNERYVKAHRMMARFDAETLPLPGAFSAQFLQELVVKNSLLKGGLVIGGKAVNLEHIQASLLHVVAQFDSLVPPACAAPLVAKAASTDKEELVLPGGHVSLVAGPAASTRMWPRLDQWLAPRSV
ncbi:alpha/beta fold hydrolase [Pseudomonas sp. NPDC090755]|uniref:alpha/beta fold hydrolase n=1 Tax=Pseudomonas sp. NPDC090755 TaxID=3364481 RepID=UPI00383A276F